MNNIQTFLQQIENKIRHSEEIASIKGENFNVFSILRNDGDEQYLHSAFLRELLSPDGTHNFGGEFLRLFIEEVDVSDKKKLLLEEFICNKAYCKVESRIGKIDRVNATGGRLDLIITDPEGRNIIIENKLYAPDQEKQVERYCNYATGRSVVFYLTLYGGKPSPNSKGNKKAGEDFFCISYANTIINWLQKCREKAADFPMLRETIKQYEILLQKLTGQLTNQKMEKEIQDLIKQNLEGAQKVFRLYEKTVWDLKEEFRQAVMKEFQKKTGLEVKAYSKIKDGNAGFHVVSEVNDLVWLGFESFSGWGWMDNLNAGFWINLHKLDLALVSAFAERNNFELRKDRWWLNLVDMGISLKDIKEVQRLVESGYFAEKVNEVVANMVNYTNDNRRILHELEEMARSSRKENLLKTDN